MLSPDKLSHLSCLELFQSIDHADLLELLPHLDSCFLPGGEILFRAGDSANAMYVVLSGRLRISLERRGADRAIRELSPGQIVGELALLTGEPRSATVRAVRDTELARLSRAAFDAVRQNHPESFAQMILQIAARQVRGRDPLLAQRNIRTLAILPLDESVPCREFTQSFVQTLQGFGSALHLHEGIDFGGALTDTSELSHRLSELENTHKFVVYEADATLSPWTQRCLRQADLIWLLAGDSEPASARITDLSDYLRSRPAGASMELVILRDANFPPAAKIQNQLTSLPIDTHHHALPSAQKDLERLARFLTGSAVGLVLSGGGARGFAHIGVIRALTERGIPIDAVGGTSMGAVIAAQHALGWDWKMLAQVNRDTWPRCEPQRNYTLPLVALNSGRRMDQTLKNMFGDARIEDLPTTFFCVSTNLTQAREKIHRGGELWKAVRASVSIPGIGPPAIERGEILIDGGLMNNLPVTTMKTLCPGAVLAVDVSEQLEFKSALVESYTVSGWKLLWQQMNPFSKPPDIPNILEILYRTTTVGGIGAIDGAKAAADFCFEPPVAGFGVFDWRAADAIIEASYRDAERRLDACEAAIRRRLNGAAD
jgi:predicted acylesterase/phospholipase RssA/CRP-like cAMP-binding protein